MYIRYFSFAIADSMFPAQADGETNRKIYRKVIPVEKVKDYLDGIYSAVNPTHTATIDAMLIRYGIEIEIPETPPIIKLEPGDELLVTSVRGLPRLTDRHEYTQAEIDSATFEFSLWSVGNDSGMNCPESSDFSSRERRTTGGSGR